MSVLRIGLAGLGTVGVGVIKSIEAHQSILKTKTGKEISISAINARSKSKDRGIDLSSYHWEDDPVNLATREDVDVFVELIGGEEGAAMESVFAALEAGKHVVTANKALIAHHGFELAQIAEAKKVSLMFEASVAGGIPIIRSLHDAFQANTIKSISGILNGTTNYMLTRMEKEGISYNDVFDDANKLGYLEADPSLDVGGIDAAHKLAILRTIAFGERPNLEAMHIKGIETVDTIDIEQAHAHGFRIKLVGHAEMADNQVIAAVEPKLVPLEDAISQCMGVLNMCTVKSDVLSEIALSGPGAGQDATASAVMSDIALIASDRAPKYPFSTPAAELAIADNFITSKPAKYYIRLMLEDEVGVLAKVSDIFAKHNISIDQLSQLDHKGSVTPLIVFTHKCDREDIDKAQADLDIQAFIHAPLVAFAQEGKLEDI